MWEQPTWGSGRWGCGDANPWEGGKSTTFENTQDQAGKAKLHKLLLLLRGRALVVNPPDTADTIQLPHSE